MRLLESYKDRVIAATDIVAVIGRAVELRKAGREWVGRCPFHEEKSGSFYVNPAKQVYKCQGCGAKGSVVKFLMTYEHKQFQEVIEDLAKDASMLPLQYEGERQAVPEQRIQVYGALENAASYYQDQLRGNPVAMAYCADRGLSEEAITRFRIGWAPDSWDAVTKSLSRYERDVLNEAGLVVVREDKRFHDRFRSRLMFPILDRRGRVIAFGGRVLRSDQSPKYLNSPDSELFHKGNEVFGLWHALNPVADPTSDRPPAKPERLVVVEGYMDVAAMHQKGLTNAVATLGTAFTDAHAAILFAVVPDITFCFDGDRPGYKAAWRALEAVLPHLRDGRSASFVFLPAGEDPDSLLKRAGRDALEAILSRAQPLSEYLFAHLESDGAARTVEGRARVAAAARHLLAKLPDGPYREALLGEVDRRLVMPPAGETIANEAGHHGMPRRSNLAYTLCGLLLADPTLAAHAPPAEDVARIDMPGSQLLADVLTYLATSANPTADQLLQVVTREGGRPPQGDPEAGRIGHDSPERILEAFIGGIARLGAKGHEQRQQERVDTLAKPLAHAPAPATAPNPRRPRREGASPEAAASASAKIAEWLGG